VVIRRHYLPLEQLRRAYAAVQELEKTLTNARKYFDMRKLTQLDTEIANAWLIATELNRRVVEAGKDLQRSRNDETPFANDLMK
jgi:hypothetical protein